MGRIGYYATLARQLAPAELAGAAARRAYRAACQALYWRRVHPGRARLPRASEGFGRMGGVAGGPGDRIGRAWCEPSRRPSVLAALRELPGAMQRALARAEAAAGRSFELFGTRVCFGEAGATDWSLDPVSGHRYPLVPADGLELLEAGVDPKYPWALGRLDHLVALGQGYWVSSGPAERARFTRAFVAEVADFVRSNPVGLGVQWACPMEVALRAANLAQVLVMFSDSEEVRGPDFLPGVLTALAEHVDFVEANLEDQGAVPNNHLIANYVGLLVVGHLFPGLPWAPRHVAQATAGLRAQMEAQVHADGCSFEGSVPYHRLVLELFTLAYLVGGRCGVGLGEAFAERLERMYRVVAAYSSERGLAPQVGDNDSSRALPLRDRPSLEHGYLPALGAALLGCEALKREGDGFPDEAAWLLGHEGLTRFERLGARAPGGSRLFRGAGWAVLRGAGAVLFVSAGRNGQRGIGGHSHNDKLSFELHLSGVPVIVDPGTGTYARDPARRNAFRGTPAHNTLEVDGREQAPLDPARLFALPDGARAGVDVFLPGGGVERLAARHRGYAVLPEPVEVERAFVLDKAHRALGVTDGLRGGGWHRVTFRLHLPDREARVRPATAEELERAGAVPGAPCRFEPLAVELGPVGAPRAVVLLEAGLRGALEPGEYSPGYGQVEPALVLVVRRACRAPSRMGWVVLWGGGLEGATCA